jgi:gamma-glutamyltranspeptidase/glutathione hydrolase
MTGGLTLLQMLNLAEQIDLAGMDRLSGRCLHQLALIMRQAWTDRYVYVGDPEGTSVPVDGILDKGYAASLLDNILRDHLSAVTEPGDPWTFAADNPSYVPPSADPGGSDTTHLAAADDDGNMVTLTQTLGLGFGSCVVVPGTGALIYNVTSWMNPEPGTPNSVGPWKKQLGHATPVLIRKDGKPVAALGAPGGRRIVSAMFQVVVNMIDFGMDVQEAIATPRVHHEGADPSNPRGPTERLLVGDDRIPEQSLVDLRRRGYDVLTVYESGTQSSLAKPLGIQFAGEIILGGVDIFRRSVGIGI